VRGSLWNLVTKEVKELLRDPKILIGVVLMPLVMFPLLGSGMRISQESVKESTRNVSIGLLDYDGGVESQRLRAILALNPNVTVTELEAPTVEEAIALVEDTNTSSILVIPQGFSENITSGRRGELQTYSIIRGMSLADIGKTQMADVAARLYEQTTVLQTIQGAFPSRDPQEVLDPVKLSQLTVIRGAAVDISPDAFGGLILSQSMMLPMVTMVMLIFSMQIAATSIAIEKEEKTLETLLTLPVGRLSILAGKLTGSIVVAMASAASYTLGFGYYMDSIFAGIPAESLQLGLQAAGLTPSPMGYALLGVTVFVTIVSALALAVSLAAFTDSVRSAQSLVGFLVIPIVVPSIVLMFADLDILPMAFRGLLYLIPYTHSIIAIKEVFMGDYLTVLRSIAYISAFTVGVLYLAARIFSTERVITARISLESLRLRRRRRRGL